MAAEEVTPPMGRPAAGAAPAPPRLVNNSTSDTYWVTDSAIPRASARGEITPRGELSITMRTVLEDGTRSTVLRGAEQFQRILNYFAGRFTSIKGSWQYGTNLAKINELTGKGMSLEAAAAETWTGQQAAQAGYKAVRILNTQGTPGNYTSVQVRFELQ